MFNDLHDFTRNEMTQRQFWMAAFLAALTRLDADDALIEADKALAVCNAAWTGVLVVRDMRPPRSFKVGCISSDPLES